MNEEVFSSKLRAGGRTYFFDVKKASNGKLYVCVHENKKMPDGNYERHTVMIFNEDLKPFINELIGIYRKFFRAENAEVKSGQSVEE